MKCEISGGIGSFESESDQLDITPDLILRDGSFRISAVVTDARGRTAAETVTITTVPYSPPQMFSSFAIRCNADGTADALLGTYALASAEWNYSDCGGNNLITAHTVTVDGIETTIENGAEMTIGGGNISTDTSHVVTFYIEDTIGNHAMQEILIPAAEYVIHIRKGGKSIGFGCVASEEPGTVKMDWKLLLSQALPIESGGTGGNDLASARESLGIGLTDYKAAET